VTAAKRTEEAIRKLNAELVQRVAERDGTNQELEAFTYTVSHDLRAPLRAIHGFVGILLETYAADIPAEARRYLDRVAANAQYMGHLVDDLLRFSRLGRQPLITRAVDTPALVRSALEQLAPALEGRQVELTVGDLPGCRGDPASWNRSSSTSSGTPSSTRGVGYLPASRWQPVPERMASLSTT
jgi:light-regulated signal transduction histidine kinase (bacteriophytochrome)